MNGQGFNEVYSMKGGIDAWNGLRAIGEYESGMHLIEGKETAEEFISLAWSLEDGTAQFYRTVRDMLSDEAAGKVFDSLVKAEETHKSHLLDAYRLIKGDDWKENDQERSLSGIMESGISVSEATDWIKDPERKPQDILEFSMQLEINSLDLYMKVSREAREAGVRRIFNNLIDEEKLHLQRLGNLLNRMYNV